MAAQWTNLSLCQSQSTKCDVNNNLSNKTILHRSKLLLETSLPLPSQVSSSIFPMACIHRMPFILVYSETAVSKDKTLAGGLLMDLRTLMPHLTLDALKSKFAKSFQLDKYALSRLAYDSASLTGFQQHENCRIEISTDEDLKLALQHANPPLLIFYMNVV
jgi:hypothetical protein